MIQAWPAGRMGIAIAALEPVPPDALLRAEYSGRGAFGVGKALALGRWLRRNLPAYDVVHIHGVFGWQAVLASRACLRLGIPYVVTPHGHLMDAALADKPRKKKAYLALVGKPLLREAATVAASSELERRAVARVEPAARAVTIHPGLALPPLGQGGRAASPARLLYLGRLHPHKQLPLLFEALATLGEMEWNLVVAGGGAPAYEAEVKAIAVRLGLSSRVTFRGHLDLPDRERELGRASLLIMPSQSESFSYAVAEALAHGIPVVTTDTVGLAELVARCGCGEVVPSGNAPALAQAIRNFCDAGRNAPASLRARACAAQELSLERMGSELCEMYLSTLRKPRAAA